MRPGFFLLLSCVMSGALHDAAHAGSLTVAPVRVTMDETRPVETMTIRNDGDEPARLQMRAYQWRQEDGNDILEETQDIVINPRLFEVNGGAQQTARLGLRISRSEEERSYRILIDQIPSSPKPSAGKIRALLRISIPVFIPAGTSSGSARWALSSAPDGNAVITVQNGRNSHLQIRHIDLLDENGGAITGSDMSIYILPGAERAIMLDLPDGPAIPGRAFRLNIITDEGEMTVPVTGGTRQNATDGS